MAKKMNDPEVQAAAPEVAEEAVKPETKKPIKAEKPKFYTYEVWKLEWKGAGEGRKLERMSMKKEVRILDEHASTLNEQRENTLLEYVKKGG